MWRRYAGPVLAGIGAFAVAAALTLWIAAPTFVKLPLDQEGRTVAVGEGLSVFYPGDLTLREGVSASAVRNVVGDPSADGAGPDAAVWNSGVVVADDENTLISTTEVTACLDRRTGAAVDPCPSARLNDSTSLRFSGQVFGFPLGTEQQDYDFFDTSTRAAFPARFVEETELEGTPVYLFEQEVPETVIDRRQVPGNLAGGAEGTTVTAEVVYSNTRTLWVDPTTGVIVKGSEEVDQYLRGEDGTVGVTLLEGTLTFDDETVTNQLALAEASRGRITMLQTGLPIGALALGLLLIGGGLVLQRGATRAPATRGSREGELVGARRER